MGWDRKALYNGFWCLRHLGVVLLINEIRQFCQGEKNGAHMHIMQVLTTVCTVLQESVNNNT
jgi:hypothetical protein